ncbi:TrkA domain-containing protein [Campylobacter blaseri]|uniref:RCK C-terminal domain-containing protein n=1 Tax=Campylobacter blaseri TaxID=2042961 RepID=A0A2P8R2C4_9BACT|nr:hypothetical protein [Campylobacter blaseri]PSM52654.1 hypothetical protein CQ405_02675 [Campylobacter blaseri]PSM54302.1 hypothetical protein CRN67_02675 [Campylobacter blaseri]QKF85953.1 TrkA domain-containing protein [Campylobacter blaseri]
MKNILIVCDGIVAKRFLERVSSLKNINHKYKIITNKAKTINDKIEENENMQIHRFDPTSFERLKGVASGKFDSFMIVLDNEFDAIHTYKNLRKIDKEQEIFMLDEWGVINKIDKDENLKVMDVLSVVSSRLISFLPDNPALADNIGVGKGEIMEVKVPIGSPFAYKKIGMILQSDFKIPILYRHNEIIVTKYSTVIFPNDSLLLVGEPPVLRNVFRSIKKVVGRFPSPFGSNIYFFVDMAVMKYDEFENAIKNIRFLNKAISSQKIYIRVINPTLNETLENLKKINEEEDIEVIIDFKRSKPSMLKDDVEKYKIGVFVTNNSFFNSNKERLHNLKIPVLTLGEGNLDKLTKGVVLVSSKNNTQESSVVFDLCSQLNINVHLYYYDQGVNASEEIVNYYENLAELFDEELHVIDDGKENPIYTLQKEDNFIQFLPFNEKVLKNSFASHLSRNMDELYFRLDKNYQLFVPSFYEI